MELRPIFDFEIKILTVKWTKLKGIEMERILWGLSGALVWSHGHAQRSQNKGR